MASLPNEVILIENFLDEETLASLMYYVEGEIGIINKVEVQAESGTGVVRKHSEDFYAERIYLTGIDSLAKKVCRDIFGDVVAKHYDADIERFEYPHIIRYRVGGKYVPHADAELWNQTDKRWERKIDRDYSAILYLNDQFEGGCLYFPDFDMRITPKPGLLVCFPSNGQFVHTAEPVTSGNRYALVTWAAARGTARVRDHIPTEYVYMQRTVS